MFNSYDRSLRVAELLKRELSYLLKHKVKDPRTTHVTITEVQSKRNLSQAKVYICTAEDADREQAMAGLVRSTGFLRQQLGLRLKMRYIPELKFVFDDTFEQGERINQLLAAASSPNTPR